MSNNSFEDPNFGMVGTSNTADSFENWLNKDLDFNLLEYIGADDDNNTNDKDLEFGPNEEERSFQQKDKIYTTLQYNQNMFGNGNTDYSNGNNAGNHFGNEFENQFPDSMGSLGFSQFSGGPSQMDNRGILGGNNGGYGVNGKMVDSSMIPTTSKSNIGNMPLPIKIEPGYETAENMPIQSRSTTGFDDSGAYSDMDDYAHSIGSQLSTYDADGTYHPRTKPRKYRLKPDEEKRTPVYRVKREKNNDAVRRSRDKAKRIQIEKDERLTFLEQEYARNQRVIAQFKSRETQLQHQLQEAKRRCKCGNL